MNAVGRPLPHSLEAEENLLSCCLLDGKDVVQRCIDAKISTASFYDPKHGVIYTCLLKLHRDIRPIEVSIVAEELKASKQLDTVGGYAFLAQVSSRIPTTAQAGYFIEKVGEMALLREVIRSATAQVEDCYSYSGGMAEFVAQMSTRFATLCNYSNTIKLRTALTFNELLPENGADELLGHNRYLGRGDSCLIVSSAGMGKSSMSVLWACHIALGRDFLGIPTKRPSRSLIIQAEDSDGDVREQIVSAILTMKLTDEEKAVIDRNVIIVRDKVNRGAAFISAMRGYISRCNPDFVWLNPLHAYAGCEITDATQIGEFLRNGLNKANSEEKFCYMIIHHTPKPMTGKAVADKKWHEFMYDAAGSAELVNWARAVITLKPTDVEGEFNLILAKRGKRAGVMQEVQGEVNTFLQPTIKIAIKQSGETMMLPGRKRAFHLLNWEARVAAPEESEGRRSKFKNETTKTDRYPTERILPHYPASSALGLELPEIFKAITAHLGMGRTAFYDRHRSLMEEGLVAPTKTGFYRLTPQGDIKANKPLEKVA